MNKKNILLSKATSIFFVLFILLIITSVYRVYKTYYFNGFIKAEYNAGITNFIRDKDVKYSDNYSYKIESPDFNDAVFYKEIKVKPNTPYRMKCMVKTRNIETENGNSDGGAQICIADSTECSTSVIGTNDWQELEFIFNSKNRETIKIGFRLGGNRDYAKGTAWFSDFTLEEGYKNTYNANNWNVACFIFKNIDVNIKMETVQENLKISMSKRDITNMKSNIEMFKNSCNELSGKKMTVTYDIYEIENPITSISYSEEYGYYIDPADVKDLIDGYLKEEEYDHIFAIVRLGDIDKEIEIPVYDWIGLGRNGFI